MAMSIRDADTAEAVKRITRGASERVARFACDYAVRAGRRVVTAVHKANVLHLTDGLFLESARRVIAGYPGLLFDDKMVDAACYLLVKSPLQFDVMVMPNQYGDSALNPTEMIRSPASGCVPGHRENTGCHDHS
jgi:isocitrate dehydrogenase (NAD+)